MPRISHTAIDRLIGTRLRQRRNDLNITMETLGGAIGVSYQQIQKYERGQSKIAASCLYEIAYQLQIPLEYFFVEIEQT